MGQRFHNAAALEKGSEYRRKGWWRDTTVVDDLRRCVQAHPDKTAIIAARYFSKDITRLTYAELARYMDRFALGLRELGVGREDIVAVQLPNGWHFTALALACARLGAVIAPIPPDYRRREVEFILGRTEASVYVGPTSWTGHSHRDMARDIAGVLPSLRHRVLLGSNTDLQAGERDFERHFIEREWEKEASLEGVAPAAADDVCNILYTSGTTGEPKGVVHSHNTNYGITRALCDTLGIDGTDVVALPSLLTASTGFTYSYLMPMLLGATAIYMDVGDPELTLKLFEEHGVTFTYGIPTYLMNLIALQRKRQRNTSSLRQLATGSIPVPPHLIAAVREVFGVRLHTLWGMTENGAVTITRHEDAPDWPSQSDGRAVAWMETKIVPALAEDGTPYPDGTGRLIVRGASQCLTYFKRDDVYAAATDAEGWFDTGDLARDDGRGGIRIVGRLKDVIFRYGYKIPVVEVESALYSHPKVKEVAVVAHSDDKIGGERVCAVVVVREGEAPPTLNELRDHLKQQGMSNQYWPDRLDLIDEMPKTATGKVRKYLLRDRLKPA
ncbi:AMP-binding protein [Corallococcus exiguus]|uniref:AMP-binding protein n=1 Tax=Corallococcus exiguus TaxID=83462 RepID=UPI000F88769E|nr:AMP-binding protein [Corallococcus exiguus]NNC14524.1 AMP-binding protein [Corallococcus exiguus]RUO87213.1 long-chain fatty acid--CoA ligase [Corallococcus sp. AB018]